VFELTLAAMKLNDGDAVRHTQRHRRRRWTRARWAGTCAGRHRGVYRIRRLPVGLGSSLVAGAISGLLGLGGGIIKVPVLNTFCGVPIRVAAATSTFMIGVTAAASAILYFARGDMMLALTAAVVMGALPGSLLGARLSDRVRARSLKVLMAVVLLVVGARMGFEGLWR
jgi:uncharacterized membrane protein YfcA